MGKLPEGDSQTFELDLLAAEERDKLYSAACWFWKR